MYRILDENYIDEVEKAYSKYHFSYKKENLEKNLRLGRLFARVKDNQILDLVIVNEREIGFNVFIKTSDNYDLEKITEYLDLINEKFYLMDINEDLKIELLKKNYAEKEKLIKYELSPYKIQNSLFLEKVNKEDLEYLTKIDEKAFGEFWKQGEKRLLLALENSNLFFYKYTIAQKIVAYTLFSKNHIMRLAVLPEYQGQGIGKNIMKFVINKIFEMNTEKITLNTQITNSKSRPLYENLGFVEKEISYVLEKI